MKIIHDISPCCDLTSVRAVTTSGDASSQYNSMTREIALTLRSNGQYLMFDASNPDLLHLKELGIDRNFGLLRWGALQAPFTFLILLFTETMNE